MTSIQPPVVVGVDPHADTLAASATDSTGKETFHLEVPNTKAGIDQLINHVNSHQVKWAIEGTGTYGRELCDRLLKENKQVVEVPTRLTGKYRAQQGGRKTDRVDAVAIARAGLMDNCAQVSHHQTVETLRVLSAQRTALVATQTRQANRIQARIRELTVEFEHLPTRFRGPTAFKDLIVFADQPTSNPLQQALFQSIRIDAQNWLRAHEQIRSLEQAMTGVMPPAGEALIEIQGINVVGAAKILAHTGDIRRFPTEGHYASFCGTAPLDASSGRQQRHRLNRGGNRQLNYVLHVAILTQLAHNGPARTYIDNRMANTTTTKKESIRAAKRKLNKTIYRILKRHPLT